MRANGGADPLVVWRRFDGHRNSIWSSTYNVNSGWQAPTPAEPMTDLDEKEPELAINSAGTVVAVWVHFESGGLGTNRYDPISGWGTTTTITGPFAIYPQVGVDAGGGAVAVWEEIDTPDRNILASVCH